MPRPKLLSDDEVLDGTRRVILRRGPARFTLADVAAEVGLARSTLIQRFESRDGLFRKLMERSTDRLQSELAALPGGFGAQGLWRFSGLTGASMAVAYACMADISDERNRAANFGLVAAALGVGIVTGPGIGGVLAHVGLTAPFLMAAGLNFLNFAAALLLLPEALGVGARRRIELARWTPRAVPPDAQGELQGNLLSLASLSAIAGPLVYTSVFARGIRDSQNVLLTGAPFLVAAAFSLLAWLLVGRREPPHETQQVPAATAARGAGGLAGGSPWTRLDG